MRSALREVVGQEEHGRLPAEPADAPPPLLTPEPARATENPERVNEIERERVAAEAEPRERPDDAAVGPSLTFLAGLEEVLGALRSSGSRKVVAIFSGGLPSGGVRQLDTLAVAASEAHAVIHVFGVQSVSNDANRRLSLAPLEDLAKATGGGLTVLGKNADKAIGRVVAEWAACYVLGIETTTDDVDSKRQALRIQIPGRALSLRAPAWLVAKEGVVDVTPAVEARTAPEEAAPMGTGVAAAAPPTARAGVADTVAVDASGRAVELQRLLSRAVDYIEGYQREHSLLVAEEEYYQSTRGRSQVIRSDLLLVRPERLDHWVSFRDVFEVDGNPSAIVTIA